MIKNLELINFDLGISLQKNIKYLGGIDEVGRGCLAGPLVTAIVVYDIPKLQEIFLKEEYFKKISLIKDSKKLSEKNRTELATFIKEICFSYHINEVDSQQIDKLGISNSTNESFFQNFSQLNQKKNIDLVLTDAFKIKGISNEKQQNIIRGDNTSFTIASASIIAKVYRDELMRELAELEEFKKYEFAENKGYGTKLHLENLKKYGPSTIHRKSFEPIKSILKI